MRYRCPCLPSHGFSFSQPSLALVDSTGEEEGKGGDGIHEAIDKQGGSCGEGDQQPQQGRRGPKPGPWEAWVAGEGQAENCRETASGEASV